MSIDRRTLIRGVLACACCAKAGIVLASGKPAHDGGAASHWRCERDGNPAKRATVRAA
jgi:carbonic anhydrase